MHDAPIPTMTPPDATSERKGYAFMLGSSLCFAIMGAFVKQASTTLPFLEVSFFRAFGGLLMIAGWMALSKESFAARDKGILIWRGVLGWAALTTFFFGISTLYLADAVLLNYTSPFFTAILATFVLGERLTRPSVIALLLASAGVALVVGPKGGFLHWEALVALSSGFFAALAYVAVKRATARNTPWIIVLYFSAVASALTLPLMLPVFRAPSPLEWGLLAGVSVSATVAQVFMTLGYKHARATTASIVSLFTPFIAALLGIVFFHDVPTWATWLGGGLILAAGLLLTKEG